MKKSVKKLSLSKEAIVKLNVDQLNVVKGGVPNTVPCTGGTGVNCPSQPAATMSNCPATSPTLCVTVITNQC